MSNKTQTRTFVYSPTTYATVLLPALWLTSATNPENGTVSYTYNGDGTLASKHDANGNTETYTYDTYGRLTSIPDRQQSFTYDTCPAGATGCVSAPGQLMQATFAGGGPDGLTFQYNYAYTPAGKVSGKTMVVQSSTHSQFGNPASASLALNYTYDNQGALKSLQVPLSFPYNAVLFTYTRDAMERPIALTDSNSRTWATGVTYNPANQMLFDGVQTWTYNSLLQATSVTGSGMSMTYNYSPNHNNGQITSSVDAGITPNETITYTYDALKRLGEADGLNWKENYVYDGFGNLTNMNPTGSAPTLSVSVLTDTNGVPNNRITASGVTYDNNGNLTQGFGKLEPLYDAANRMTQVHVNTYYGYDPDNRRVYSGGTTAGTDTIYLYGVDGKKLGTYTASFSGSSPNYTMQLTYQSNNVYFAGRLISAEGNAVRTDRLGSVRAGGPGNLGSQAQYPYGAEYGTGTANDREKYATYTRDSLTGLDYAMNRYYSSQWGRFLSVDPSWSSVDPRNPPSWNRYVYVLGDAVNGNDPTGLVDLADIFGIISGSGIFGGFMDAPDSGGGTVQGGNFTSGDITGTQTSGYGVQLDENGNPVPLPVVGNTNTTNTGNIVSVNESSQIVSVSVTSSWPGIVLGGAVGGLSGGPPGAAVGAVIGSMCGAGGNLSLVGSTVYAGPTASCGSAILGGSGVQASVTPVPPSQDPNNIANGASASITIQPTPITGSIITKSPGSGPPVVGFSFGSKIPVSGSVGYNWCIWNCNP